MISIPIALALVGALVQGPQVADSGDRAVAPPVFPARVVDSAADSIAANGVAGPRLVRVGFLLPRSRGSDSDYAIDTASRRPRAIEYSDAYYKRLTIHRVASYAELPLFGVEYVLGERLLNDERTGDPPSSLKAAHVGVAGALGVLFALNTVTGVWNLWDSRHDPSNHTLRIVHAVAMLSADAGFALAGAIGGNAKDSLHDAQQHRAVSVASMAVATAGTAIMWFFNN